MNDKTLWHSRKQEKAIESYMQNYLRESHANTNQLVGTRNPTALSDNRSLDDSHTLPDGIPMPIVNLSRWLFTLGPLGAMALMEPMVTTVLLVIDLLPLLFGREWSLAGRVGALIFARHLPTAEREDRRVITFNRTLVVLLLALAQVAFWLGAPALGWALALMVAAANGIALAGFCVGCFLYYNFKLYRFRLERRSWLRQS
jgi:hypothetical protein